MKALKEEAIMIIDFRPAPCGAWIDIDARDGRGVVVKLSQTLTQDMARRIVINLCLAAQLPEPWR